MKQKKKYFDYPLWKKPETPSMACLDIQPSSISETVVAVVHRLRQSRCQWKGCQHDFVDKSVNAIAQHISGHSYNRGKRCRWSGCYVGASDPRQLSAHMLNTHGIFSNYTLPDQAFYCHQCAEWSESLYSWDKHCEEHVEKLKDRFCGRICREHVVICAALCPFCLGKSGTPLERYRQFTGNDAKLHILKHISDLGNLTYECPYPLCNETIAGLEGAKKHITDVHGIGMEVHERPKMEYVSREERRDNDTVSNALKETDSDEVVLIL